MSKFLYDGEKKEGVHESVSTLNKCGAKCHDGIRGRSTICYYSIEDEHIKMAFGKNAVNGSIFRSGNSIENSRK